MQITSTLLVLLFQSASLLDSDLVKPLVIFVIQVRAELPASERNRPKPKNYHLGLSPAGATSYGWLAQNR